MTPITDSFTENASVNNVKDPRWLQVEVCREFQRGKCTRAESECRFAHPDENVQVENGGRVTACFDSMKDRCQRESCKYFHPPHHIKLQLEANGRLLKQHKQQLQAMASQNMIQTPATVFPLNTLQGSGVSAFPLTFVSSPVLTSSPRNVSAVATTNSNWRTEKVLPFLEVCHDYVNGVCSSTDTQCSAAHPPLELLRDRGQKRITVCMDFVKGRCKRDSCRYFHPPSHLQGKLKTVKISQSQLSVIPTKSRKRPGESKDDLEEQAKQQALNYTLINTPVALPTANFTTIFQPSTFQATSAMQFAPAFFSTLPLTVPQLTTTNVNTAPFVHPQIQPEYNYVFTEPGTGVFYGYQPYCPANGYQYIPCADQQLTLNNNQKQNQRPICRDYKAGNCRRNTCRFIHLDNRNVEVVDGQVTICVDALKGTCHRTQCKYYHKPVEAKESEKNDGKKEQGQGQLPLV